MFEKLAARAAERGSDQAGVRRRQLAAELADRLPRGVRVAEVADAVTLEGIGLRRRFALEPALRWLIRGLVR